MTNPRTISVFLASSDELMNDRESIDLFIHKLNDIYQPRGINVKCQRWEDLPAHCTGTRTQDNYNKVLASCNFCLCLFHRKAGKYTIEEFNYAMEEYMRTKDHPKTIVYVRALVDGEVEDKELTQFKKDLYDKMGHYWCNYTSTDSLRLQFIMQFEQQLNEDCQTLNQGQNITVEHGYVMLHGKRIVDYANVSFAAENAEIKFLKEKIKALDDDLAELQAEASVPRAMINRKVNERNDAQKQLDQLEKQLLDMALSINKMISSGDPISQRKRKAIELFEKGDNKGVLDVLNTEEIQSDYQQAKTELLSARQIQSQPDLLAKAEQKVCSLVDELTLKAKTWMTSYSEKDRFEQACQCYELAIQMYRECELQEALATKLSEFAMFLQVNNQFHRIEVLAQEALELYSQLIKQQAKKEYRMACAGLRNILYLLYLNTQRYDEAENCLIQNLETYGKDSDLCDENMYIAALQNYGMLHAYRRTPEDIAAAVHKFEEAISRCRKLVQQQNEGEDLLAQIYANYGLFYSTTLAKPAESIKWYDQALEIQRRLVKENEMYKGSLAMLLGNYAMASRQSGDGPTAADMYEEALELYEELYEKDPNMYAGMLATIRNNWAELMATVEEYDDAIEAYNDTLEMLRELCEDNATVYQHMMALALQSLAQLYALPQYMQERKAESCINEAVQIFRSLVRDNPNTFTHLLIQAMLAKIDIEIQFERLPEACKYTVEAENLCRKDDAHTLDFKGLLAETLAKKALCMYIIDDYEEIEAVVDEAIVLYNQMAVESSELWYNNKKKNLLPVIIMIGEYYEEGSEEVEQDINTAIKWYRKAAMEGDEEATQKLEALSVPIIETVQPLAKGTVPTTKSPEPVVSVPDTASTPHELFEAGKRYYYGIGVQKDYATAAQLFLQAVQQEYLPALVYLGYCFFYGRGVEENKQNAIELYQAAANAGDARAQYTLGWCYYTGNGVNQDYREAVRWFNEACINGYVEAQLYMGICYEHGTGVNKNPSEAARWYRKAADNGLCEAQMRLGRIYYHGLGVMRNYAEAVRYFNQAVAQGHIEANVYLGCCYDLGRGVGENKTMAVNLYRRAAEQGSTEGQYSLGKCYYHGNGVVLDYAEAIKWLVKAAEAGHADAQKYVGRSYELGRGVDVNIATAIAWYQKAAAQGHMDAKDRLKHLS